MQEAVDIFSKTSAAPQNGAFFKFAKVGDAVQGTYVDRREGKDGFGNDQIIYVLKDSRGELHNAAFRTSSVVVHERMKKAKLGYVVGFKYDSDGVMKRGINAGKKFRIVNPYFDGTVDQAWVDANPNATFSEPFATTSPADLESGDAPEDHSPVGVDFPEDDESPISIESLETIRTLARTKGLINTDMTDAEADTVIAEFVGMDLAEENLAKIIIKITSYRA